MQATQAVKIKFDIELQKSSADQHGDNLLLSVSPPGIKILTRALNFTMGSEPIWSEIEIFAGPPECQKTWWRQAYVMGIIYLSGLECSFTKNWRGPTPTSPYIRSGGPVYTLANLVLIY